MNIKINQLFIHRHTAECRRHCRHTQILDINNNEYICNNTKANNINYVAQSKANTH